MEVPDRCAVPPEALELDAGTLARLPRSARLVFAQILDHGPATQPELAELSGLPIRTVRFAAKRLLEEGLVRTHLNFQDVRRRHFCVSAKLVTAPHLRKLGVEGGDCVVVVQHNGRAPSANWKDVLFRAPLN